MTGGGGNGDGRSSGGNGDGRSNGGNGHGGQDALEHRSDADRVRAGASEVAATARVLATFELDRVARSLGRAAERLADPRTDVGREARRLLPDSTGLSPEMIDWAMRHNVATADAEAVSALARRLGQAGGPAERTVAVPPRLVAVVLAGNVFTASLRGVFLPLLARSPVVAKASSRDDIFPRLLGHALQHVDSDLSRSYAVLTFPGGSRDLEDALFSQADVVSVYGSDATIAAIRGRLPGTTRFVPHGHGLGVIYVPAEALADTGAARRVAEAVALDVAAYDQRGCLSPHAVWVEPGGAVDARGLASLLAEQGLAPLARSLPRGPLPTEAGAAQVQWRGVAEARGELFEGDGFATSYEGDGPLRLSPGYRNVAVLDCDSPEALGRRLEPLGVHLKALGVAGSHDTRRRVAGALPPPLAPRISGVGAMQTPPFDALADGELPWATLPRWIEID